MFYDINKLARGKGILRFPVSLARIANAQTAKMYFEEYIPHFTPSKIVTPTIGANFCYGDWLYMYDNKPASELKKKHTLDMCSHQNGCMSYIWKPQIHLGKTQKDASYYVPQAFSFNTRSSLYFQYNGDFNSDLNTLYNIYKKDPVFQKYIELDCAFFQKEITENQILFFLEEHLMMYFIAYKKVILENKYVPDHDRVLLSYPGAPLKNHIYIHQQNFFKCPKSTNIYQDKFYDLTNKILRDLNKIDLATYTYENI